MKITSHQQDLNLNVTKLQ